MTGKSGRGLDGSADDSCLGQWHPKKPMIASTTNQGNVLLWHCPTPERWGAFAGGFEEVDENVEYEEREDEFDIVREFLLLALQHFEFHNANFSHVMSFGKRRVDLAYCGSALYRKTRWTYRRANKPPRSRRWISALRTLNQTRTSIHIGGTGTEPEGRKNVDRCLLRGC